MGFSTSNANSQAKKVKREGKWGIVAHENYLNDLHGNLTQMDQYMLFRAALSTPDLGTYVASFAREGVPALVVQGDDGVRRLMVTPPNGYTIEIFEDAEHGREAAGWSRDPEPLRQW